MVAKLLNIVQADRAYFGQKDYQQLLVIERMVRDLNINTEIVAVPTARASDGLALSSRNVNLSADERRHATVLYRALKYAESAARKGTIDAAALRGELEEMIRAEPTAKIEYVALVHPDTMLPVETIGTEATLVALAVRIGTTRLIDNILVSSGDLPATRTRFGRN